MIPLSMFVERLRSYSGYLNSHCSRIFASSILAIVHKAVSKNVDQTFMSLSLHRAFRRFVQLAHQLMHIHKIFTLKHLKSLQHVSILK